jgi:hypothetical protein
MKGDGAAALMPLLTTDRYDFFLEKLAKRITFGGVTILTFVV